MKWSHIMHDNCDSHRCTCLFCDMFRHYYCFRQDEVESQGAEADVKQVPVCTQGSHPGCSGGLGDSIGCTSRCPSLAVVHSTCFVTLHTILFQVIMHLCASGMKRAAQNHVVKSWLLDRTWGTTFATLVTECRQTPDRKKSIVQWCIPSCSTRFDVLSKVAHVT